MFPAPIRVLVNFAHSGILSQQSPDDEGKPLIYPCSSGGADRAGNRSSSSGNIRGWTRVAVKVCSILAADLI
jgi:hypothetical protein